jgi:hypothetical protein
MTEIDQKCKNRRKSQKQAPEKPMKLSRTLTFEIASDSPLGTKQITDRVAHRGWTMHPSDDGLVTADVVGR